MRVQRSECGEEIYLGSLVVHLHMKHGKATGGRRHWGTTATGGEPHIYDTDLPTTGETRKCPVDGCQGRAATWKVMRVHFLHHNVGDNVLILEEGNLPQPQCPRCDMLVPWRALNRWHITTTQCTKGAEINRQWMAEEELQESVERAFQAYVRNIETVTFFKYLGQVLTAKDDEWTEVVGNLSKAQKSLARMERIMVREGANPRVSGMFFKAVVQAVLLFRL